MSPFGGTRYGMYVANLMYGMRMLILDIHTWPRGDVPSLGLTDILAVGLIEYSYHQCIPSFLEPQPQRNLGLTVLGPEQFQDG
jgi:hypothetical protein